MAPHPKRTAGFTLIELLVAVAVLAILATLALPSFQGPMVRQQMVARLLKLADPPKPADAADALAIALCHLRAAPLEMSR